MNPADITISKLISAIFIPVVDFLKQQGIWDSLVRLYNAVSGIIGPAWQWLNLHANMGQIFNILISFIKFVITIFITLFNVLITIFHWVLGLFK